MLDAKHLLNKLKNNSNSALLRSELADFYATLRMQLF